MLGGLCLSGCCGAIGFDGPIWGNFHACFDSLTPRPAAITNIGTTNIGRISECKLVFGGSIEIACGPATSRMAPSSWSHIKDYIMSGGRLYFATEFGSFGHADGVTAGCLQDPPQVNSFLSYLGASLHWDGDVDISGNGCNAATGTCTPGAAAIAVGCAPLKVAVLGLISGGTSVWITPAGNKAMVVEKLGNGFLFLCGDSNPAGCGYDNCDFFRRLFNNSDENLI